MVKVLLSHLLLWPQADYRLRLKATHSMISNKACHVTIDEMKPLHLRVCIGC